MIRPLALGTLFCAAVFSAEAHGQHGDAGPYTPRVLDAGDGPEKAMQGFTVPDGFRIEKVAAEPDLANPVAFHIGDDGRIYVVETHRLRAGVIDMRGYTGWVKEDLACETVPDRIEEIREHFGDDLAAWTSDHERIRCLIDDDRDGRIDRVTVFADGFNRLEDGIAAGVLADGKDVWFTDIPSLWKLTDADRDGVADARDEVQYGYGVHFSLIGHDMHGLRIGPDRRLYFSIGDRGFHVETDDGRVLAYPHEGAVLRCELDGTDLEVVHRGLRNPQELAFDEHGNLFTGDNNSDGGDKARWVYVVEGGHSGWTIGFQWLPTRGAWNEEGWWKPRHADQPQFLTPPIANVANGPSGLTYYPGTGLPAGYEGTFFLCEFRGGPANSGILALRVEEDGAGFKLTQTEQFLWRVLCTDIEFGPGPGIYALDWVQGWGLTGRGRIWRTFAPEVEDDPAITETARILGEGFADRSVDELTSLLAHRDQRVRQGAQFALCDAGEAGRSALASTAADRAATTRTRLHGVWGLGYRARREGGGAAADALLGHAGDADPEVRAHVLRVLGEAEVAEAIPAAREALRADQPRVRFFGAQALGRLGATDATHDLIELARTNDDADVYLRHAVVTALARIGDRASVHAAAGDDARAVRLVSLLVQRLWTDPAIAGFLDDPDAGLVLEAARAIHDERIQGALEALAARVSLNADAPLPLLRRVLGAHRILGAGGNATALWQYAARADAPEAMRVEALEILAEWAEPDGQDRVLGEWRALPHRNTLVARSAGRAHVGSLLAAGTPGRVVRAACVAADRLRLPDMSAILAQAAQEAGHDGETRARALITLEDLGALGDAETVARGVGSGEPLPLRRAARDLLARIDPAAAVTVLASLAQDAGVDAGERRGAIETLGTLPGTGADRVIADLIAAAKDGGAVPASLALDVVEAGLARKQGAAFEAASARIGEVPFGGCAEGGNQKAGERIFREHPAAQCMRCHSYRGTGGQAGPSLDGIGKLRDRDYLLRALIEPGTDIAEGFAQVTVTRKDGSLAAGVVQSETQDELVLIDANSKEVRIAKSDIANRETGGSAMPPMGTILSRREIRDVIEFLSQTK